VCGSSRIECCSESGCRRVSTALCDYPMDGGKTCDARLCETHRVRQPGHNRDFCPKHAEANQTRVGIASSR
jgi:hypothetical protein